MERKLLLAFIETITNFENSFWQSLRNCSGILIARRDLKKNVPKSQLRHVQCTLEKSPTRNSDAAFGIFLTITYI